MNGIVPAPPATLGYSEIERLAESIAKSGLFGMKTREQAIALMMIAVAEGRHPALAARDYDVIQGRPAKKAEAMLRDFLTGGGKVEWTTLTDDTADATFSHPQGGTVRIVWDTDRAALAGLANKENWKKYPRQMLRSRVVSEGVRTVWPMATSGMYEVSEIGDMKPANDVEHSGPTIEVAPEATPPPSRREQINAAVPMPASAVPPPPNGKKAPPHSIAPPPGAPDEAWRACLDKVAPALAMLRSQAMIEATAAGPTCGDIMQHGPDWAKAELALLLADNVARVRRVENAPEHDNGSLPPVEIAGEGKMAAG